MLVVEATFIYDYTQAMVRSAVSYSSNEKVGSTAKTAVEIHCIQN